MIVVAGTLTTLKLKLSNFLYLLCILNVNKFPVKFLIYPYFFQKPLGGFGIRDLVNIFQFEKYFFLVNSG